MMVSAGILSVAVMLALLVTVTAPIVLIVLWIKDWKKGQLW